MVSQLTSPVSASTAAVAALSEGAWLQVGPSTEEEAATAHGMTWKLYESGQTLVSFVCGLGRGSAVAVLANRMESQRQNDEETQKHIGRVRRW